MKAEDIINQLRALLPLYTDKFTTNLDVISISSSLGTANAQTSSPHGLEVGDAVNIIGARTPINIVSFTRIGTIGFIETLSDHDYTEGVTLEAVTQGAAEPEFNGTFTITSVPNRRNITIAMDDSGPISASGNPEVINGSSFLNSYNGLKEVIGVTSDTIFSYDVPLGLDSPANTDDAMISSLPRISGVINLERLIDAYTQQPQNDYWLFVSLADVVASKDRAILSDAVSNTQRGGYYRQQVLQNVNIYVVIPTSNEIAAREAVDNAQDVFRPICQSILFEKFDSGLYVGKQSPLQFISHGVATYTTAFYIHSYTFEQTVDLQFEDTVGYSPDVAFRDILLNMTLKGAPDPFTNMNIDLDDEPLP